MVHIRSRKHSTPHAPRFLPTAGQTATAAAAMLALALPMGASAQQAPGATPAGASSTTLPEVRVKGKEEATYKADTSSSPKFTEPLVNTPQTITVIKKELLLQQGATTLSEALRNTPGVTFTMGENGNTTTGDSVFMRGFDTQGSIFVDGIRDLGTISRDIYNLDQVEVVKGPAGADIGRGSPTGYINLSTKVPTLDNLSAGSLTLGSGSKKRVTADFNRAVPALGEGTAVRLNLLLEDSGVIDRDHIEKKSIGFAPSIALGLNSPTRTYLYYQHVDQNNLPDGGVPAIGRANYFNAALNAAGIFPPPTSKGNFYGSLNDFDDVKADMFTARIEHTLAPGVVLRNTSRFGRTEQQFNLTGINAVTLVNINDPATWTVSRSRQGKDQENTVLTNQTNLSGEFATGAVKHAITTGVEFIYEKQTNYTLAIPTGSTQAVANLYNPSVNDVFQPLNRTGASTSGNTTTVAAYLFDTLKLNEQFQLNAGLRWERYKTEYTSIPAPSTPATAATSLSKVDDLLTYKLGALYKPAANGSVYVAYGTSQKPPGSDSFALNAGATNINNPNFDPAKATNIELGTKWDLLDNRLALTAAIYRAQTENDVVDTDPVTNTPVQVGKKTVKGIELAAAGMLTSAWQLSAGLGLMDTEINATTVASSATQQGNPLAFSPKVSFTSWSTYKFPFGLTVGGGVRYAKSTVRNSTTITPTSTNITRIPSYTVVDAMAAYELNKNVTLQFNLYNVADKFYIQSLNNGGSRYVLGAPRSASITANVQF